MIIFSHRGCGFNKEENSIEGFSEAFKKNFSLELDVRKTKDNFLVISHDADLKRVGGIDKKICTINYYEIKKIIPKFSEVCKKIVVPYSKNNLIAVHLKTKEKKIIKEVYAEISSNNLERNFFIFDILKEDIDYARNLNKNIKIGLSIGEKRASESVYLWEDLKNKNFEIVWWDEWNNGLYNQKNIDTLKKAGKIVYAVSPELHKNENHPYSKELDKIKEYWKKLINLKVDGICTDYPKELRALVYKEGSL